MNKYFYERDENKSSVSLPFLIFILFHSYYDHFFNPFSTALYPWCLHQGIIQVPLMDKSENICQIFILLNGENSSDFTLMPLGIDFFFGRLF